MRVIINGKEINNVISITAKNHTVTIVYHEKTENSFKIVSERYDCLKNSILITNSPEIKTHNESN